MSIDTAVANWTARIRDRYSAKAVWPAGYAGAYLGMGARDPVFTGPEHACLIIGPPRSGKTTSTIIPAVALWDGPAVTTSTKADIAHVTNSARSRHGQTWLWDPTGRVPLPAGVQPLQWSPLAGCADWDTAIDRAWILAQSARPDPTGDAVHWTERAAALLAPLLHGAALGGHDLRGLLEWIHQRETFAALDQLSKKPATAVAHNLLCGIARTEHRELSGIWSTADSILAAYRSTRTLDAACHPNFDPAAFAQTSGTAHFVAPASRAAQHAPIICALLDQIRQHTQQPAQPSQQGDRQARQASQRSVVRRPMLWALDELANVAPLPNLPAIVADAGSQGLLVLACLQDLSQARARWGAQADGLLTLFATTLLLPGVADPQTLRTVTTLAGKVDRPQHSHTRTGILKNQHTTSTRPLPLLPESVIANGKPGHALHLKATQPTWLQLTPWHTTPWIANHITGATR